MDQLWGHGWWDLLATGIQTSSHFWTYIRLPSGISWQTWTYVYPLVPFIWNSVSFRLVVFWLKSSLVTFYFLSLFLSLDHFLHLINSFPLFTPLSLSLLPLPEICPPVTLCATLYQNSDSYSPVKCWNSNSMGTRGVHQGGIGASSDEFLRCWTRGVSTPDLIVTEFWKVCGQTDLASACVLCPLNCPVLDFKAGGLMGWMRGYTEPEMVERIDSKGRS